MFDVTLTNRFDSCINENFEKSFAEKAFYKGKAICVLSAAIHPVASTVDTIFGVVAGMGAICSLGLCQPINSVAVKYLKQSRTIVASSYLSVLTMINSDAERTGKNIIGSQSINSLKHTAKAFSKSGNFLKRNIASRLTYAVLAVACVVARIAHFLIGTVCAALSILCMGKVDRFNSMACEGLQAPRIIFELFDCALKMINPWAQVKLNKSNSI